MGNNFSYPSIPPLVVILVTIWTLFWKGFSLWRSAKFEQKYWFLALLISSTAGILDIVYLFYFAKKKLTLGELKRLFQNKFYL